MNKLTKYFLNHDSVASLGVIDNFGLKINNNERPKDSIFDFANNLIVLQSEIEKDENILKPFELNYYQVVGELIDKNKVAAMADAIKNGKPNTENLIKELTPHLRLICAALLLNLPDQTPGDFEQFKKQWSRAKERDFTNADEQAAFLRYLGQAFISGENREAVSVVVDFLDAKRLPHGNSRLFIVLYHKIIEFILYKVFPVITEVQRVKIMERFTWDALEDEVEIALPIGAFLADADLVATYVRDSGLLAKAMAKGSAKLHGLPANIDNPQKLIAHYENYAGKDDFDVKKIKSFAENVAKKHVVTPLQHNVIIKYLELYINLRECSLIDYRGLLSDSKIKFSGWDWDDTLNKDFSESKKVELQNYLTTLHRPLRVKMELVVAIEKTTWQEEPVLSRILNINDIYLEVYGDFYGPIVYFDAESETWKLNKDLPEIVFNPS